MIQLHLLGQPSTQAHGVVGRLDVEWVHFLWNTWILGALLLLVFRFRLRSGPWLWATFAIAGWHEVDPAAPTPGRALASRQRSA